MQLNYFPIDKLARPGQPLGVYIHIPFCIRKCPYCDFYSVADLSLKDAFLRALALEMQGCAGYAAAVDTLYVGGGTPSVLTPAEIAEVLAEARRSFSILPGAELTLEINPGTVTPASLSEYRRSGFNRVNIGVQSFQNHRLEFLGRIHGAADAVDSIRWARRAGFAGIGIDLIYAVPGQTEASWLAELELAVSFRPEHLSCYMLTVENETPLDRSRRQGRLRPLAEEKAAALYTRTVQYLAQNGYTQYEVSNFSRSGPDGIGRFPSRHNQKYWTFAPYLGLGPAAHSFLEPVRFWNPRSLKRYIDRLQSGRPATEASETLSVEQQVMEAVLLGLRTTAGIRMDRFREKFGQDFLEKFRTVLPELRAEGMLKVEAERCLLTPAGMLLLDSVVDRMVGRDLETA